ncbi:hypothetical protein SAMN05421755_107613 [Nitrosomonas sp. Nm33]|nr:hypothetical protein SAMN05421755_107613 [Nitrosomonas sp. Nm33]
MSMNTFIINHMKTLEMIGVIMRICNFTMVSWLGPESPFMFVWTVNTLDSLILTWCAFLRKDAAYTLLNIFWILMGVVVIARTVGFLGLA